MNMGMVIEVTSGAIATLREEASRSAPLECCGLLLGQGFRIDRAVPAANVHPEPDRHFEIEPQALIDAFRSERNGGPEVIGYYHSHPNGHPLPSATDCAHAGGEGRVWAIVAAGDVRFYHDGKTGFEALPSRVVAG